MRYHEELADQAVTDAALHEKWLLPGTAGALQAEGMERTYRFQQPDIAKAVDINAARKAFDLDLPSLGPYRWAQVSVLYHRSACPKALHVVSINQPTPLFQADRPHSL